MWTPDKFQHSDDYRKYLKSPVWAKRRRQALREANYTCQSCGSTGDLQVHHENYNRLWGKERREDLTVLCWSCHQAADSNRQFRNGRYDGILEYLDNSIAETEALRNLDPDELRRGLGK